MAKAATQTTVTLKHIAAALAGTHEMAKKQSETILGDFVGLVVKHRIRARRGENLAPHLLRLGRARRDLENLGHFFHRAAFRNQLQHFPLAGS